MRRIWHIIKAKWHHFWQAMDDFETIMPFKHDRDPLLMFVIAVLVFLGSVSLVMTIASDRAANEWRAEIRSEMTFRVRPSGQESGAAAAARAAEVLAGVEGVREAEALAPREAEKLLEPWLGEAILKDLPVPNLVIVRLDEKKPADKKSLRATMDAQGILGELDDHSVWLKDIERAAALIRFVVIAIGCAIAACAVAMIAFATMAGLKAKSSLIDTLSLCGASDLYIAKGLQWRYGKMVFQASLIATTLAALFLSVLKALSPEQSLAMVLPFLYFDLIYIIHVPFLMAILAGLTARVVGLRQLKTLSS